MIAGLPPAIEIPEGARDLPDYAVRCRAIYPDESNREFNMTVTGSHFDRRVSLSAGAMKADQKAFDNAKPYQYYWAYNGSGPNAATKPIVEDFVFGSDTYSFTISLNLEIPKTKYLFIHVYEQISDVPRWLLAGMCWPKSETPK